jgi:hypothetical protein
MSWTDIFNLFNNENLISHEDRIERLKACNKCEYRIVTNLGLTKISNCGLCGCFNLQKSKLKESKGGICPSNPPKWKKLNK